MSNCGYYKIYQGKQWCEHPQFGADYSRWANISHQCEECKRRCGGIYPTQLPTVDLRGEPQDICDRNGRSVM